MTCLIDSGAAAPEMASHCLTVGAVLGRSPRATRTSTASTSASSAPAAQPSSNPTRLRASRSGVRSAESRRKPCMACGGPKPAGKSRRFCEACEVSRSDVRPVKGMCRGCGESPVSHRRARYCDECRALQREAALARKKAGERAERLPCKGCGKVKPPGRAREYCDACRRGMSGPRICERCPNPSRSKHSKLCVQCKAQAVHAERAYARKWHEDHPGRRSGGVKKDSQRMYVRLVAEKDGRTLELAPSIMVDSGGSERRADSQSFPGLPAAPFVAMIERLIVKQRAKLYELALVTMDAPDGAQSAVCAALGIPERRFSKWRQRMREIETGIGPRLADGRFFTRRWGDGDSISFDLADRALANAGLLWLDVWEPDAVCSNGRSVEWVFTTTDLLADAA